MHRRRFMLAIAACLPGSQLVKPKEEHSRDRILIERYRDLPVEQQRLVCNLLEEMTKEYPSSSLAS